MAGDYIELDHELAQTPQVLALHERTGAAVDAIVGRLALYWCWVDRMTEDGFLPGVGPAALARQCGGDGDFWRAVEAVGWLRLDDAGATMPDYQKRFSNGARRRMKDRQRKAAARRQGAPPPPSSPAASDAGVDLSSTWPPDFAAQVPQEARRLFTAGPEAVFSGRLGDEDRLFLLRLAALRLAGHLSEAQIVDGLEAIRRRDPGRKPITNRPAYFWRVLLANNPEAAAELKRLMATCRVPETSPTR